MCNSRCQLSEEILRDLLSFRESPATLLSERSLLQIFEVSLHKTVDRFAPHVPLLLEIPGRDLAKVGHLEDQVQVVVVVVIDHFVELGDVRVVQLRPKLDLRVHLVQVVDHLHCAGAIIPDSPFSLQSWLMHHLHREFDELLFRICSTTLSTTSSRRASHTGAWPRA